MRYLSISGLEIAEVLASSIHNSSKLADQIYCEKELCRHHGPVIPPEVAEHASADPYSQQDRYPGRNAEDYSNRQDPISPAMHHISVDLDVQGEKAQQAAALGDMKT